MEEQSTPPAGPRQQLMWLWHFIIHHPPVMYALLAVAVVAALLWALKRAAGKPLRDLEKRAQGGDIATAAQLGEMYRNGEGAPVDYRKSAYWYRIAAEAGNAGAQAGLGALYYMGQGMKQDYVAAERWNRLAAEAGDAQGQSYLALLNFKGKGVPPNPQKAYFWALLAVAPREKGTSMSGMPSFVAMAKEISANLTQAERDAVKERVKDWKPTPKA